MSREIIDTSDFSFDDDVLQSNVPVLVDFWASWCMPCRMMTPVVDSIAAEFDGQLKVAKLNVDENPATASRFGIMSIPTLILFKNGSAVKRIVGYVPKEELKTALQELL